jgi:predicted RNase H-like nuclease (RuvC/YqgF family)
MPINKFGLFEQRNDAAESNHLSRLVTSYVHQNALCRVATDYDARSRKIRRVAQPEADTDAVNKLYLEECIKMLRHQQKELDERLTALEKDVRALQTAINELRRAANSETTINLNE